jgi:hypothetical protein
LEEVEEEVQVRAVMEVAPDCVGVRRLIRRAFAIHSYPLFDYRLGWSKQMGGEVDKLRLADEAVQKQVSKDAAKSKKSSAGSESDDDD